MLLVEEIQFLSWNFPFVAKIIPSRVHSLFLSLLLLLLLFEFFTSALTDCFHWSLSDSKYPQVSRTHLSIQADLNNAVFWVVSTRLLISKSSTTCINHLIDCNKSTNYNCFVINIYTLIVFSISVSSWSFSGVRATSSLKSRGLFSVFWLF